MKATYIGHMGSDLTVVNAARVSFAKVHKEFQESDEKLIRYLAKHNHWTPFGHVQAQFHFKAPIFMVRQLQKHTVGMHATEWNPELVMNEVSRRYVDEEPELYWPKEWRGRAENKKQGSSEEIIDLQDDEEMGSFSTGDCVELAADAMIKWYNELLAKGVCPEQARMILPQNMYTEWYWTGSLAAWARIFNLRMGEGAQAEHKELFESVDQKMTGLFPVSWPALTKELK